MVRAALKRPITVLVLFMGLLLFSIAAIRTIPIDIFPKLNLPTIRETRRNLYILRKRHADRQGQGRRQSYFQTSTARTEIHWIPPWS